MSGRTSYSQHPLAIQILFIAVMISICKHYPHFSAAPCPDLYYLVSNWTLWAVLQYMSWERHNTRLKLSDWFFCHSNTYILICRLLSTSFWLFSLPQFGMFWNSIKFQLNLSVTFCRSYLSYAFALNIMETLLNHCNKIKCIIYIRYTI